MPLVSLSTSGSQIVASAQTVLDRIFTLANGDSTTVSAAMQIQSNNLPNAFVWIEQTAGGLGMTFAPQFAVTNITVAGVSVPDLVALNTPNAIFLNTPAFFNFRVVANVLSLDVVAPPAGGPFTVRCVVAASQ
tara:strand:+ start:2365 stop:2763 length:399 start_codon:yes stop_codon:yes gene_type:complete